MSNKIFIFNKAVERKSGVFTLSIFSACLLLLPLPIAIFDLAMVDLLTNVFEKTYTLSQGLLIQSMEFVMNLVYVTFAVSIPMSIVTIILAFKQLLISYVMLENGALIKLRWQPRPSKHMRVNNITKNKFSTNTSYSYSTLGKAIGVFQGISQIQNPQIIESYLDGTFVSCNIECCPLENIQLIKKTKKKVVITADTLVRGKPKRKKMNILCIYNNMESITSICEGGMAL